MTSPTAFLPSCFVCLKIWFEWLPVRHIFVENQSSFMAKKENKQTSCFFWVGAWKPKSVWTIIGSLRKAPQTKPKNPVVVMFCLSVAFIFLSGIIRNLTLLSLPWKKQHIWTFLYCVRVSTKLFETLFVPWKIFDISISPHFLFFQDEKLSERHGWIFPTEPTHLGVILQTFTTTQRSGRIEKGLRGFKQSYEKK